MGVKSIRRCGIYDGLEISLSPCFPLAFLWEPMQYYEDLYIEHIYDAIKNHPDGCMTLQVFLVHYININFKLT